MVLFWPNKYVPAVAPTGHDIEGEERLDLDLNDVIVRSCRLLFTYTFPRGGICVGVRFGDVLCYLDSIPARVHFSTACR